MKFFERKRRWEPQLGENPAWRGHVPVRMLRTVAGTAWEYLANHDYYLTSAKADEFIVKGYAEGELTRPYSDDERISLLAQVQAVNLG